MAISIHAPRVGRDLVGPGGGSQRSQISIHAPRVGRDLSKYIGHMSSINFNPRAPCGARRRAWRSDRQRPAISIHAPRVGRDCDIIMSMIQTFYYFNPRAPCGARRQMGRSSAANADFNPRAPCGARPLAVVVSPVGQPISIHAPRVGRDLPCRVQARHPRRISIHAPRVGRDGHGSSRHCEMSQFQSTRPVWGATIHTPITPRQTIYFNPRAPCGARRCRARTVAAARINFNPRAPCGARLRAG